MAHKPPLEDFLSKLEQTRIANAEPLCNHMGCRIPPLKGEAFCAKHMTDIDALVKRLSGSEPPYKPELWNENRYVQMVHNCFAYSLNILSESLAATCKKENVCNTHQPGEKSKWLPMKEKTCPNLIARILGDDSYKPVEFHERCPEGTSMVAFIIDEVRDYHVLRLDTTGYFSHKGGQGPATDKDARGHKIADVRRANFNYSDKPDKLNYKDFCGYFCISRSVVHAAVPKGGRRATRRRLQKQRPLSLKQRMQKKKNKTRLRQRRSGK